jgi:LPS-assembly lipoprotein
VRFFSQRFSLLLPALLGLLLSGCGFQLSGYQPLPTSAQQVALSLESDTPVVFEHALRNSFRQQGILLNANATYQLIIEEVEQNRREITLDSSANTDEYEMLMQVHFSVLNRETQKASGNLRAFSEKILDYDANNEAASATLETTIKREMWQTLADRIVRQFIARAQ